ncbi:hypothetical protein BGZ81_008665 [Podila clonocystis]|nr:hypothetical protein BGZ81_008665 [Podila clonocystis]
MTVVVPSLPTEVVVRVVEPMVVVVVETVELVVVVLESISSVACEAVLSKFVVKEREAVDKEEDSAEGVCDADAETVAAGDVGRSAGDVSVTADVAETGKDTAMGVGDDSGTREADKGVAVEMRGVG